MRNPVIIHVAEQIGRTPSALAMKMVNFSSLDPVIRASGRSGLGNASNGDRRIWEDFVARRDEVVDEVEQRFEELGVVDPSESEEEASFETEVIRSVKQRRGQRFFRASVLASYNSTCCISGIQDPRLLIASHIVPWRADEQSRLDPSNGLCLSSLHDRLFDAGIITVTPAHEILVSTQYIRTYKDDFSRQHIHLLHGSLIASPRKFAPTHDYLDYHNNHVFLN